MGFDHLPWCCRARHKGAQSPPGLQPGTQTLQGRHRHTGVRSRAIQHALHGGGDVCLATPADPAGAQGASA